jgi:hypothetical protein
MSSVYLVMGALLFIGSQTAVQAQDANREVVVTRSDLGSIVNSLARRTGGFKDEFDHEVEHTMDNKHVEERAKHRADDLHDTAKRLKDVYDDKHDKLSPKVREEVDKTLAAGSELSKVMQDHRFTDRLQQHWQDLRSDLNALAAVYELTPIQ